MPKSFCAVRCESRQWCDLAPASETSVESANGSSTLKPGTRPIFYPDGGAFAFFTNVDQDLCAEWNAVGLFCAASLPACALPRRKLDSWYVSGRFLSRGMFWRLASRCNVRVGFLPQPVTSGDGDDISSVVLSVPQRTLRLFLFRGDSSKIKPRRAQRDAEGKGAGVSVLNGADHPT